MVISNCGCHHSGKFPSRRCMVLVSCSPDGIGLSVRLSSVSLSVGSCTIKRWCFSLFNDAWVIRNYFFSKPCSFGTKIEKHFVPPMVMQKSSSSFRTQKDQMQCRQATNFELSGDHCWWKATRDSSFCDGSRCREPWETQVLWCKEVKLESEWTSMLYHIFLGQKTVSQEFHTISRTHLVLVLATRRRQFWHSHWTHASHWQKGDP